MTETTSINILVGDNNQVYLNALNVAMTSHEEITLIGIYPTMKEVYTNLEKSKVDVLVLDTTISETSASTTIKDLKDKYPQLKIICLSVLLSDTFEEQMIASGASDCVSKLNGTASLIDAITICF